MAMHQPLLTDAALLTVAMLLSELCRAASGQLTTCFQTLPEVTRVGPDCQLRHTKANAKAVI